MIGGFSIVVMGYGLNDGLRKPPSSSQSGTYGGVIKPKSFAFISTKDSVIVPCQLLCVAEAFWVRSLQWKHSNVLQQPGGKSFVRELVVLRNSICDTHGDPSRGRGRGGRSTPESNKIKMILPTPGHVDQRKPQDQ